MADYTGSFSGSFEGNGNGLTNVDYYNLSNLPTTITPFQRNSISANNAFRDNFAVNIKERLNIEGVISSSAQLTTEFDLRYGNEEGDNLISGSSQVDFDGISNVPSGLVSGSTQITDVITDSYISASAAASGFGQGGGTSDYDELINVPSGIISSSAQITALGYSTTDNDNQTLSVSGQTLTISNGNSVILPSAGGGGGSSIWTTGSQDPEAYTHLMTSNNLQLTGSFDVLGDLTVNGKSIFTQTSASDNESAVVVNGRIKILEQQIEGYIASASIQIGNTRDSIDCGGFF